MSDNIVKLSKSRRHTPCEGTFVRGKTLDWRPRECKFDPLTQTKITKKKIRIYKNSNFKIEHLVIT